MILATNQQHKNIEEGGKNIEKKKIGQTKKHAVRSKT
jgi:hypothetical protein